MDIRSRAIARRKYLIHSINFVRAKRPTLIGADREDIIQEGMIGLYKAIRDFKPDKLASFRAFAELCITRQIITAIKTATRQKHIPLNSYVSLNKPIYDEESVRTLLDVLSGNKITDPEELVISREEFNDIESKMDEFLSDLERNVLNAYLDGKSYQEITRTQPSYKSVDNALQRVNGSWSSIRSVMVRRQAFDEASISEFPQDLWRRYPATCFSANANVC